MDTHRETSPEGAGVPDPGGGGEGQSCEADGQDEAPQDHLRDPQSQHDPSPGPVLPEPGQAAGQGGWRQGARGPAAGGQSVHRHDLCVCLCVSGGEKSAAAAGGRR